MGEREQDQKQGEQDRGEQDRGEQGQPEEEERDEERERIHQGHERVDPEPAVTAGLDQFTEEEKRQDPTGVMPGAGPDEEPGPDRDRRDGDDGDDQENQEEEK